MPRVEWKGRQKDWGNNEVLLVHHSFAPFSFFQAPSSQDLALIGFESYSYIAHILRPMQGQWNGHRKHINPNTFAGLVGKVRKKLSPEGGRKGGGRKKARAARPPDPGLEPGTCRVLGEGLQLHATGAV